MELKFRAWNTDYKTPMYEYFELKDALKTNKAWHLHDKEIEQWTGLKDANNVDIYIGDILKFDNGDTFTVCTEDYMEIYADWNEEPECEDQVRDLYRIKRACIIGNIRGSEA